MATRRKEKGTKQDVEAGGEQQEKKAIRASLGTRDAGVAKLLLGLLPFLLYITIVVISVIRWNPCDVPKKQRKDCGWPGISLTHCVVAGKLLLPDSWKEAAVAWAFFSGLGFSLWSLSRYPLGSLVFYQLVGLATAYQITRCCHDDKVKEGIPHCFFR